MSISRPVWRTIFFHSGAVVAASIWLAGCDRSPEPSTSPTPQPSRMVAPSSRVVGSKYRRPDEDRFVVVGQAAPSFGGFFIDPTTGDIVVHVADSSQFGLAVASLRAHLSDENFGFPRRFRSGRILVRKVAYSFQQLSDWRDIASDSILGRFGADMVDLDEVRNRVAINVAPGQEQVVRSALAAMGVPSEALYVTSAPAIRATRGSRSAMSARRRTSASSLNDTADSLAGGFNFGWVGQPLEAVR
jgi:hypothetical protein